MPTDPKTLPEKYPGYLADHRWVHVTRDHPRAAPPVGIFDTPVVSCIELNVLWSSHVVGALGALIQRDAWTGDEDEVDRATQQIEKFINRLVVDQEGCDSVYRLRQNPANPCQLQQSVDGGMTWELAYDFSLCQAVPTQTQVSNYYTTNITNLQQLYQNYVNNYTDNITNLYEDLGYDATSEDDHRDDALCYAAGVFVDSVCEQAIKSWDELETSLNNVKLAVAIAGGIAALVGVITTGGIASIGLTELAAQATIWAAGIGLANAVGEALYTQLVNSNRENYENEAARLEVQCCLYNALKGANVNQDVFKAALDGCSFDDDGEAIRQYAMILLQEDVTYATFASALELAYRQARVDILPVCPCNCEFMVEATADPSASPFGQDSGISVISGHSYDVTADGIWSYAPGFWEGDAAGNAANIDPSNFMPAEPPGVILWKIGAGGTWAAGGPTFTVSAGASGHLFFAMNDRPGFYADNSGGMCISVEDTP